MTARTPSLRPSLALALVLLNTCTAAPAGAQLASLFYHLTSIQTVLLPNAVRIVLHTDGAVVFGGDFAQFLNLNDFTPKPVNDVRIRLLHCYSSVQSLQNIGSYPVDSALVRLAQTPFSNPFFRGAGSVPGDPQVDVDVRFYVPVTIQRFLLNRNPYFFNNRYEDFLRPLEASVQVGEDGQSVEITVITDRQDRSGPQTIVRSPTTGWRHVLHVDAEQAGRVSLHVLHMPLEDVLNAISRVSDVDYVAGASAASKDVSITLPHATPEEAVGILARAYDLSVQSALGPGNRKILQSDDTAPTVERLPVYFITPDEARLMFPDFLLSSMHGDAENNALIVSGTPQLVDRVKQDLQVIDRPIPQVRIEVTGWEIDTESDLNYVLSASRTIDSDTEAISSAAGQMTLVLGPGQIQDVALALSGLSSKSHASLVVHNYTVSVSGKASTLFLGETRTIQVLVSDYLGQTAVAQQVPIGYSLTVAPTVATERVLLAVDAKISTLNSVNTVTGLPTVGIREAQSQVEIAPGDTLLLAGLDLSQSSTSRSVPSLLAPPPILSDLFSSDTSAAPDQHLLLMISVRRID